MDSGVSDEPTVPRVRRWSSWNAFCTVVLGLGTSGVAVATQHIDLVQIISVTVSAAVGAGLMAAMGFGPGARATKTVVQSASPDDVDVQDVSRAIVTEVVTWVAFAAFVAAVYEDLFFMGALGIVIGVAGIYDASIVRTWERENDADLGWVLPDPSWRLRHPFRRPSPIVLTRPIADAGDSRHHQGA